MEDLCSISVVWLAGDILMDFSNLAFSCSSPRHSEIFFKR